MRLIDWDKVLEWMHRQKETTEQWSMRIAIENYVDDMPTVEAEPIRHGHWTDDCRCSECGAEAITEWNETGGAWVMTPFCPFCGAEMEMDGEEE